MRAHSGLAQRISVGVLVGLVLVGVAARADGPAATGASEMKATQPNVYRVISLDNGRIVRSRYAFTYQDITHPDLTWLRRTEGLDEVVAGARREFEIITRLAAWTARQWMYGGAGPAVRPNGVQSIADVHQGRGQGRSCGMFCEVFMVACASFGIHTRPLSIGTDVLPSRRRRFWHAVADVWSNDYRKWVFVDGEFACYFEDQRGIPQSIYELQEALLAGRADEIRMVFCGEYAKAPAPMLQRLNKSLWVKQGYGKLHSFYNLDVVMGDDLVPHWVRSRKGPDGTKLGHARVFYVPDVEGYEPYFQPRLHYETTRDRSDVDWNLYEVEIDLDAAGGTVRGPVAGLTFRTVAPNLDCFLVRTNGGEWVEHKADAVKGVDAELRYRWRLGEGLNRLDVRVRNQRGRLGGVRSVRVSNHPRSVPPVFLTRRRGFAAGGMGSVQPAGEGGGVWASTKGGQIVRLKDGKQQAAVVCKSAEGRPIGIVKFARDSDGRFYVADGQKVYKCGADGRAVWTIGREGPGSEPFKNIGGVAVGPKGRIYVTEADLHRRACVQIFDADGRLLRSVGTYGDGPGQFNLPAELAVSRGGQVFVADAGNHRVQVLDADGKFVRQIGPEIAGYGRLRFPSGLTLAAGANGTDLLYIVDAFGHKVVLTETDGTLIGSFGGYTPVREKGKFLQPRSVAMAEDRIYVLQPPVLHVFRMPQ